MKQPKTDTELYENLRTMFGTGDFDQWDKEAQWFRYVQVQVAIMKRWRSKRGITLDALWNAALYCQARHIPIERPIQLTFHLQDAYHWKKARDLEAGRAAAAEGITLAVARERALSQPDPEWIGRLLRAEGDHRVEVLAQWEKSYSSRTISQSETASTASS